MKYKKKFALIPVKERLNIFNEGKWLFLKYYYQWEVNGITFKESACNFDTDIDFIKGNYKTAK